MTELEQLYRIFNFHITKHLQTFSAKGTNSIRFNRNLRGGVNSGVLLMHLERMRQLDWQDMVMLVVQNVQRYLTCQDQDVIGKDPQQIAVLTCPIVPCIHSHFVPKMKPFIIVVFV